MSAPAKLAASVSISEKYAPAMSVTTQTEADTYFEVLVEHCMSLGNERDEAEEIERNSIAYFAGYFPPATRVRVEQLFKCRHPVFGAAAVAVPTAMQAYNAGLEDCVRILREAL